ncbi:hypothetical protein [Lacunimicrobium album]
MTLTALLLTLLVINGCGQTPPPPPPLMPADDAVMTLETWNALPENPEKYDPQLIQKLRKDEPRFRSEKEWKTFYKDVVITGVKKIAPYTPPEKKN